MITGKIDMNSAARDSVSRNTLSGSCIDALFVNARFFLLATITLVLLLPGMVRADGLFDFQMKLAKKGNAEAEYKVGEMYETGFGVKKDMTEAMSWITKSADQGHETAGFKLLYWDVEKNGITDANKAKVESLKAKAKDGNPQAQYYVGSMYANGVGVKKDSNKAISWLNKAALVGVLAAERELTTVREGKQRAALAKRRAEEKKRAQLKARQEREKQAKIEQQRKLQAQKQADAKARAEEVARQNKSANAAAALEAKEKADKAAAEEARQAKLLAQQKAEAKKRESQKQALLKKRAADE
ncbi:MAG TPA: sel1 repeat family protein, partial [Gammaproteobacteria bacterium]|nr:sel1 repeat family protein [Gammaproteobacteria bacterium]